MKPNYKFHALAVAAICIVITLLYTVMQPKQAAAPADPALTGDRYIEIYSATWGETCNPQIKQAILERQAAPPLAKTESAVKEENAGKEEEAAKLAPLELVVTNNALLKVSTLCNGKLTCEFKANSAILESEPLSTCLKNLDVGYRCFSYDRLWTLSVPQGQTLKIDCHDDKTATPPAK